MQANLIDIVLMLGGLFVLYGVVFKPGIFWERGRIQRTRNIIGDRNTAIMYVVVGVIMFGVGVWGALGGL